jgi:hypothetical protein
MEQTFEFTDNAGRKFRSTIKVVDLKKAALTLTRRARSGGRKTATALDGSIKLTFEQVS